MERQRPRRGPAAGSCEDGKVVILRESMHMYGAMCTLEARAATVEFPIRLVERNAHQALAPFPVLAVRR